MVSNIDQNKKQTPLCHRQQMCIFNYMYKSLNIRVYTFGFLSPETVDILKEFKGYV
jgi:hypothetical protein